MLNTVIMLTTSSPNHKPFSFLRSYDAAKRFLLAVSVGTQLSLREPNDRPFAGTITARWLPSVHARIASREPVLFALPGVTEVEHHAGIPGEMGRQIYLITRASGCNRPAMADSNPIFPLS